MKFKNKSRYFVSMFMNIKRKFKQNKNNDLTGKKQNRNSFNTTWHVLIWYDFVLKHFALESFLNFLNINYLFLWLLYYLSCFSIRP